MFLNVTSTALPAGGGEALVLLAEAKAKAEAAGCYSSGVSTFQAKSPSVFQFSHLY